MRRTITLISAFALMLSMLVLPAGATPPDDDGTHGGTGKVTLCHATHSTTNPYVVITIDPAAIFRQGHDGHHWRDPHGNADRVPRTFYDILAEGGTPTAQNDWDDIIPAFHYSYRKGNDTVEDFYPGLNWPTDDQGNPTPIWNDDREGALEVLADLCFGEDEPPFEIEGNIAVEKTVETSFDRTHNWDIDKRAETEDGHTVVREEVTYPKIWLHTDGSGDETATWVVDVPYEGYTDGNFLVSGEIEIVNNSNVDVVIESIDDVMSTDAERNVTPSCPVQLPATLEPGDDLVCTYSVAQNSASGGFNEVWAEGYFTDPELPEDIPAAGYDVQTVAFGSEPDSETNKTIGVSDTPFGASEVFLGTVTAPNDGEFEYTRDFAFGDFATCGSYRYDNTATIEETGQSASASLLVNVQCMVPSGDTATGDGLPWSKTNRAPNNWFMYTTRDALEAGTVDLIAGQHYDVGDITLDGTKLSIVLDGAVLAPGSNTVKVHPMKSCGTNQSYVQPGQFALKGTSLTNIEVSSVPKIMDNWECIGIHLDVLNYQNMIPDPNFGP